MKPIIFTLIFFFYCCGGGTVIFAQEKQNRRQPAAAERVAAPEMMLINNKLTLKNAPVGQWLEIFTILGNKVRKIEIRTPNGEYDLNLPQAIYIFKLDGVVKKFVVREGRQS
ncbi:MAG: T9SS type A sorting domain-containing protein [Dysgonamonadaceae bacterium]|jgi:hypothetical protein|nr:T9SS type A sorting domain-containing protein [Dysgonamonadaceae bacterium]